jgi:hypothetical protein
MLTLTDTLKPILALAKAGAADTKDFMREHLLAIRELARKALVEGKNAATPSPSDNSSPPCDCSIK